MLFFLLLASIRFPKVMCGVELQTPTKSNKRIVFFPPFKKYSALTAAKTQYSDGMLTLSVTSNKKKKNKDISPDESLLR